MIITMIPANRLDAVWPQIEPILARAVKTLKGKFFVADIKEAAKKGDLAVWGVFDEQKIVASFTTRIIAYPAGNAMALDWVAGTRMKEWLADGLKLMEKYAKEYNCRHLEGYGRNAWSRVMGAYGWRPEYIAYRKDLTDE